MGVGSLNGTRTCGGKQGFWVTISRFGFRVQVTDEEVEQGVGDHANHEKDVVRRELDIGQREQICGRQGSQHST